MTDTATPAQSQAPTELVIGQEVFIQKVSVFGAPVEDVRFTVELNGNDEPILAQPDTAAAPAATLADTPLLRGALDDLRTTVWVETSDGMTCSEADALAAVFRAIGADDIAEGIESCHPYGDDDCDDAHHDEYLRVTESTCGCQDEDAAATDA